MNGAVLSFSISAIDDVRVTWIVDVWMTWLLDDATSLVIGREVTVLFAMAMDGVELAAGRRISSPLLAFWLSTMNETKTLVDELKFVRKDESKS